MSINPCIQIYGVLDKHVSLHIMHCALHSSVRLDNLASHFSVFLENRRPETVPIVHLHAAKQHLHSYRGLTSGIATNIQLV